MKINRINKNIIRVIVDNNDYELDAYYDNLIYLESRKILTFGDTNFRILNKYFEVCDFSPEQIDLCLDDDKSIGLEMPKTWYLNKGKYALSIAMYYIYLNYRDIVENKNLESFNKKIVDKFGRIGCIEVYLEDELKKYLNLNKIKYFGTPRTLTECVRYLEGWSVDRYPRLKSYAIFSKFIELWSRINYPHFNASEWYLGKERSNQINNSGQITNVRKAVRFFWENYLLKKNKSISDEDIEIDILGGDKFYHIRQPKLIIMSEDLFSKDDSKYELFKGLTNDSTNKIYISKQKNNYPLKNAEIARELFSDSLIVLIENGNNIKRNFSLINPIKHALNVDVVVVTKVLRIILEKYFYE